MSPRQSNSNLKEVTMIADDRPGPIETAITILTAPIWIPFYGLWKGCGKLGKWCAARHAPKPEMQSEVLQPQMWTPVSDLERQVFAAMILAGRPVTNAELARLMGVSAGQASRMVSQLEGRIERTRVGREVRIALPHYH